MIAMYFGLAAKAQLVQRYFPLNSGDQRLFSVRGAPLTMSVATNDDGIFAMTSTFAGSSEELIFEQDSDAVYVVGEQSIGPVVSFDTPVTFLTDSLLQKGGTVRTDTTVDDGLASAIITVTVENAGTVTVPAGRFANCKTIITHTKAASLSSRAYVASSSLGPVATIVAPGVGPIKAQVLPGIWAVLENATIGRVAFGNTKIAALNIQVNGGGIVEFKGPSGPASVSPLLQIGSAYTAIAKTEQGSVFEQWTDGESNILSTSPEYTFTMETNLVLEADFIPNPFASIAGTYIGLFEDYDTNTLQNSGYFRLTVNTRGDLSGYWETGVSRHPFSGLLNAALQYTNSYEILGEGMVTIGLSVLNNGTISGSLSGPTWNSAISAVHVASNIISQEGAGIYDIDFTSAYGQTGGPSGVGKAVMNFSNPGPTTLAGALPDGPRFIAYSDFSPDDPNANAPFYAPLYGGKGYLLGWMDFGPGDGGTDYSIFTAEGNFVWLKPDGLAVSLAANGRRVRAAPLH